MTKQPLPAESQALATLVHLQKRARVAEDEAELHFILANETHNLAPYRQSALWLVEGGVVTLSGVVAPEANAPYVQWLTRIFRHLHATGAALTTGTTGATGVDNQPRQLQMTDLPAAEAEQWQQWLPAAALLLPLPAVGRYFVGGALLLVRDHPWKQGEIALLGEWTASWAHLRALVEQNSPWRKRWQRLTGQPVAVPGSEAAAASRPRRPRLLRRRPLIILLFLLSLLLPVRLTVLAPGELIPLNPSIIRAPVDGVIEQVLVIPNQLVAADEPLFSFDHIVIQNRLQIAIGALNTVKAEYRQWAQQSLVDPTGKNRLAELQGQIAEKEIEVAYLRELYERGVVTSSRSGMVLFDDPREWIGRPVVTGERVMIIADEREVQLEAWLAPGDAIPLAAGSRVRFFLNADPLKPIDAILHYVAHEAIERPDGHYAYRVRASLRNQNERPIRIGLKGTAKLEGEKVALGYWIFRRPLASTRAWLGI